LFKSVPVVYNHRTLSRFLLPLLLLGLAASNYLTIAPPPASVSTGRIFSLMVTKPEYRNPHVQPRSFTPAVARSLGARTDRHWLVFLFASFCAGVLVLYGVYVPGYQDWFREPGGAPGPRAGRFCAGGPAAAARPAR
jgi:hypothetical protein